MIFILLTGSLLFAKSCPLEVPKDKASIIIKKANWEYKGWITSKGTRSEGKLGILFYKKKQYCPKNINIPLKIEMGKFKFIKNKMLWGFHGWKIINLKVKEVGKLGEFAVKSRLNN